LRTKLRGDRACGPSPSGGAPTAERAGSEPGEPEPLGRGGLRAAVYWEPKASGPEMTAVITVLLVLWLSPALL
jgi:hypothetical protein